jgi:beta-glucosidase
VELSTAGLQVGAEPILPADAVQRAASAAADADVALVIVGYDGRWESESFDRPHMNLPGTQDALIRAVLEANPRTVVAVNAGSPVTMDWSDDVPAVLQLCFPGQECGTALADVLFGDVDASGRLPTTFPRRLEDTPAHANYPGSRGTVQYAERLLVGYRHYDRRQIEPRWAFGHGLSYTTFGYGALHADIRGASVELAIDVTNTGSRLGSEVVQVYVHDVEASVDQPDRQLAEFSKVRLAPAETQTVRFTLPRRAFAYWDVASHDWKVEPGAFEVLVGSSSRAIRARALVHLE